MNGTILICTSGQFNYSIKNQQLCVCVFFKVLHDNIVPSECYVSAFFPPQVHRRFRCSITMSVYWIGLNRDLYKTNVAIRLNNNKKKKKQRFINVQVYKRRGILFRRFFFYIVAKKNYIFFFNKKNSRDFLYRTSTADGARVLAIIQNFIWKSKSTPQSSCVSKCTFLRINIQKKKKKNTTFNTNPDATLDLMTFGFFFQT